MELRNYQVSVINTILDTKKVAIWLDMGMGKTRCVIEALGLMFYPKTLIVAPKFVAETTWKQEFEKWDKDAKVVVIKGTPTKRKLLAETEADVYIIGRDSIDWFYETFGMSKKFDCIVMDESSSFKNPSSKRFKAIRHYTEAADRVIELTGTPAANGYVDLWAQVFLLDGGTRLGRYVTHFKEKFFTGPVINGYKIYTKPLKGSVEKINELISDITFSLKAKDNLELPERIDNIIRIEMDSKTEKRYIKMRREYILSDDITAANAAVLTQKLAQLANGFVYTDDGKTVEFDTKKLEYVKDLIDSTTDHLLIYAMFKRDLEAIEKLGAVSLDSTKKIEDWQQGKIKVAVAHPASIGYGINLQAGGHVIVWYSLPWSLELYLQANGRLHRQGQEFTVTVNHMITAGSIEEDIYKRLQDKTLTQDALMEAVKLQVEASKKDYVKKHISW